MTGFEKQLRKISEDCQYSAQTYFEAAKIAEYWGRVVVFIPALLGALSGVFVALFGVRELGAVSAISGAVAATASFVGVDKRSSSFKDSAKGFTRLRHQASLELDLMGARSSVQELEDLVRSLRKDYEAIVSVTEPAPDRAFRKARSRICGGVLKYSTESN
ncbi:hypothetical protein JOF53_005613 [Crossiella equi]|uniref:SLATT domain-containing protein n=1 Tax=Crossiella equi TaxID=130796 RepID=A0ABS5AJJ3_9PSEU|nr:SLATT domain-containing protein [Crossiella equi]MBP2476741.1 hypothetical protein [Crossiella equi]